MKHRNPKVCLVGLLSLVLLLPVMAADEIESYPKLHWRDEIERLRVLATQLEKNPQQMAYISYRWTDERDQAEMKHRVQRAARYLIRNLHITAGRIVIMDGGRHDHSLTVIIRRDKDLPPPVFN